VNTRARGQRGRPAVGRQWICKALAVSALTVSALAVSALAAAVSPAAAFVRTEAEWLTYIENYLNLVRTVEASFLQVSSNGEFARGRVYISRPGRMRVEYDPPAPHLIVANDGILVYVDRELGQRSHVPLSATPAAILLAPSIRLRDGELRVIDFRASDGGAQLTVVQKDSPGEGSLTLLFSDPPLSLRQWTVTDAQGISTTVTLENPVFDKPLPGRLFQADDPRFK
jgi:outer membrane lipoprotein-sorting protein